MRKATSLLILNFVLLLAVTAQGQTNPGVNNAELNGSYAFTFNGVSGNATVSSVLRPSGGSRQTGPAISRAAN